MLYLCSDFPAHVYCFDFTAHNVFGYTQAYEDYLRHRADSEVNNRKVQLVKNGRLAEIKSASIHVGDIVRVDNGQGLPCDLVLLATSDPTGLSFVTTAGLDGETNLKVSPCPVVSCPFVSSRLVSCHTHITTIQYVQYRVYYTRIYCTLVYYSSIYSLGLN